MIFPFCYRFEELGTVSKLEEKKKNETLFNEGDSGNSFYLMVHGELEVLKIIDGENKSINTIHPGQYFGEIALVQEKPRSATIRAKKRSIVLSISKQDFSRFFKDDANVQNQCFLQLFLKILHLRLVF